MLVALILTYLIHWVLYRRLWMWCNLCWFLKEIDSVFNLLNFIDQLNWIELPSLFVLRIFLMMIYCTSLCKLFFSFFFNFMFSDDNIPCLNFRLFPFWNFWLFRFTLLDYYEKPVMDSPLNPWAEMRRFFIFYFLKKKRLVREF